MNDGPAQRPGFARGLVGRWLRRRQASEPADVEAALAALKSARQLRLFVSSTFQDMQSERDELLLKTFPRFERLCRSRDVQFLPIDLRWGVTQAQAERGEILRICFDQVDRSRPFFLGLIGERYGWTPGPEALRAHLGDRHAWALAHPEASVTELEFRRGLERLGPAAEDALIYAKALGGAPPLEDRQQEDWRRQDPPKIAGLKRLVAEKGARLRDGYASAAELGAWVYEDLCALLDRHFPQPSKAGSGASAPGETSRFLDLATAHFTGRAAALAQLDDHRGGALALVGPVGIGKTAVLAAWRRALRDAPPAADAGPGEEPVVEEPVVEEPDGEAPSRQNLVSAYFAGATSQPSWRHAARAMLDGLGSEHAPSPRVVLHVTDADRHGYIVKHEMADGASQEIDALLRSPTSLSEALAKAIAAASRSGRRVTLIIDGLDEIAGQDPVETTAEEKVSWLPMAPPDTVRIVASASDPDVVEALRRRGWRLIEMDPLDVSARRALIDAALGDYGKALDAARIERLAQDPKAGVPLFLRIVLDELRLFGRHETLDDTLEHYLAAADLEDLYERVLARWEEVFEAEQEVGAGAGADGIVGAYLGLAAVARRGVLESDLLAHFTTQSPTPRTVLDPLSAVAAALLQEREGRLTPGDGPLRRVIDRRYLATPERRRALHGALAARLLSTIYPSQPTSDVITVDAEDLEDLRLHLREGGMWRELAFSLSAGGLFATHTQRELDRFVAHWRVLGEHIDLEETYRPLIEAPERFFHGEPTELALNNLAFLLMSLGRADLSEAPFRRVLAARLARNDEASDIGVHLITSAEGNLAAALEAQRKFEAAAQVFGSALQRSERRSRVPDQATFLSHLARVAGAMGQDARAETMLRRLVALSDEHPGLETYDAPTRLGELLLRLGRADEAADMLALGYREVAAAQGPLHPDTATAAIDVALAQARRGAWADAEARIAEAEAIIAQLPEPTPRHRVTPLHVRALAHAAQGRPDAADQAHRAALALVQDADAPPFALIGDVLLQAASFWETRGDADLVRRALERLVSWPLPDRLEAVASRRLGAALLSLGDAAGAEARLTRCVAIEEGAGRLVSPLLREALSQLGDAAERSGDAAAAQRFRRRAEAVDARADAWRSHNEGEALLRGGDPAAAVERLAQAVAIKERLGGPQDPDTALSARLLGDALARQGRFEEALDRLDAALAVFEKAHPDGHEQLEAAASSIAHACEDAGLTDRAEAAYRRTAAEAARAFGDPSRELARSRDELAAFLRDQQRPDEAIVAYTDALAALEPVAGSAALELAEPLTWRGRLAFHRGRRAEAEADFRRAVQIREQGLGEGHPDVAASLNELGFALRAQDRPDAAEDAFKTAIERLQAHAPEQVGLLAASLGNLATLRAQRSAFADAIALRVQAVKVMVGALGPDHDAAQQAVQGLRDALDASGASPDAAREAVAQAVADATAQTNR